ncbi:MAG: hypothetical protein ACFHVJ_18125 [Aestuariibacter sp.]
MSHSVENIVKYLHQSNLQYKQVQAAGLGQRLITLREWQCRRLIASHSDIFQIPRFKPAIQFFIDELYGPKDFTKRDKDIARVVPKMQKWLPSEALESLEVAIHLNTLSQELDIAMLDQLQDAPLCNETYAQAYRDCDNKAQRELQIDSIEQLGIDLKKVVDITGISMILRMARTPAKLAGLETLQAFLEDGFNAFKRIGKIEDFIVPVVQREREIMEGILNNENVLPEATQSVS